ncbi:MAG: hypothetical protein KC416_00980 [Myxococcales bacterium]|nr:hypothetical protein [Myxococcales bacterium]
MKHPLAFLLFALPIIVPVIGCDSGSTGEPGDMGQTLTHTFESLTIKPGEEFKFVCQSWTLNNEEPIFVNSVTQTNGGAWHHSNWYFVPERKFDGPDGTWDCVDRGFDNLVASGAGGVLFAQSTQATEETQKFPDGMAVRIPPRARVIGDIHLLNASADTLNTALSFEIATIPEDQVETELFPMSFTNIHLNLEPRAESHFVMDCDIEEQFRVKFGGRPDFNIYYVLPHYHDLGNLFRIEAIGGEDGDKTIFETNSGIGDPLGMTLTPPFAMNGATRLRLTCGYDNPRDERVGVGFGDQEMCIFLAYTDAPAKIGAFTVDNKFVKKEGAVYMNDSQCGAVVL